MSLEELPPPSYNEVVRDTTTLVPPYNGVISENASLVPSFNNIVRANERLNRQDKLMRIADVIFSVLNFGLSGMIGFALFLIKYSKVITMHKSKVGALCEDPNFNFPLPALNYSFTVALPMIIFFILTLVMYLKARLEKNSFMKSLKYTFVQLWTFWTHLGFLLITLELLNLAVGLPAPYYFSSSELKAWHCNSGVSDEITIRGMTHELRLIDEAHRCSFPSRTAAIYTFCTVFLYLCVDHFDVIHGLHATQQVIAIVLSCYSCHCLMHGLERGEYHLMDVFVGAAIGFLQGVAAVRNIFGTVFYQRSHISNENLKTIGMDGSIIEIQRNLLTHDNEALSHGRTSRSYLHPRTSHSNCYPSLYNISEV